MITIQETVVPQPAQHTHGPSPLLVPHRVPATLAADILADSSVQVEVAGVATVREGHRVVLVVVDMQAGVLAQAWDAERIIGNVAHTVERARTDGVPVVWVQHSDEELPYGSPQWQWAPGLAPAEGEPTVHKHHNSSFEATDLDAELARRGATHIALAGATTNWCIRATAYGALDRGYDLTLVEDAHTTETMRFEGGRTIAASDVIDELNTVMRWVSYPGRTSSTATSAHIDFAALGAAPPHAVS